MELKNKKNLIVLVLVIILILIIVFFFGLKEKTPSLEEPEVLDKDKMTVEELLGKVNPETIRPMTEEEKKAIEELLKLK